MDFNNIRDVNQALKDAQGYEEDTREATRESILFVNKRDGQWEPQIIQRMKGRPRYTVDKVTPLIKQVYGEIENADFTIRVKPAGGEASKDNAKIYDGLIRNIRNVSGAENIFNSATLDMLEGGFAAWEVKQEWADADSFDQDLFIEKIYNAIDRVWFDPNAEKQDNSDAMWCVVLSNMSKQDFEKEFPDSQPTSVNIDRESEAYGHKNTDVVTVGKLLYKKPIDIEIAKMSDGSVYKVDDDFERVTDDLANPQIDPQTGLPVNEPVIEVDRRIRKSWKVYSRLFTDKDWLTEEEETVFTLLPVIAMYGNYKVIENKRIWSGIPEKLLDAQRIYNYSISRQVEDTALSPKPKLLMTHEQAAGNERQLKTMNTNNEPVLFYNAIEGQNPPFKIGGSQVDQGLSVVSQIASTDINAVAGLFSANIGDNAGLQSGIAIDLQQQKGNNGMQGWITSREIATCYTGKVLVDAIPRVYDSTRQIRILQEDGAFDMQTINQRVIDSETLQTVELHNLSAGTYDVTCEAGLAFKSRQREEKAALIEMSKAVPELTQIAADILLKNTEFEGLEMASDRMRLMMLNNGSIPQDQMTDEELARLQAAQQQPPQPDPSMLLAQAEMTKAQADMLAQQNKQAELQIRAQDIALKAQGQQDKLNSETQLNIAKVQQGQIKLDQEQQKIDNSSRFSMIDATQNQSELDLKTENQRFDQVMAVQQMQINQLTAAVNNLIGMRNAIGVDTIMGDTNMQAYIQQADQVLDTQEDMDVDNNIQ